MNAHSSSVRARPSLAARSVAIASGATLGELLEHLGDDGFAWLDADHGFVTSGTVLELDPSEVAVSFAAIAHERVGDVAAAAGPRAVGALPFTGTGRLLVPARITGIEPDGHMWQTTIGPDDSPEVRRDHPPVPTRFGVASTVTEDDWQESVTTALELIDADDLQKVVLARQVTVDADSDFDRTAVLAHLRGSQPGCIVYADGGFVGASPELLVRRRGDSFVSRPLAGTGATAAQVAASGKDAREHRFVVDAVLDALAPLARDLRADAPATMELADLAHLATTVTGRVREDDCSALDLALALHPTPAVAGTPTPRALRAIEALEPLPRGRYAGPCGWVDANGDGEFVVALRCADLDGHRARLYAGAGIVTGSQPDAEWSETQAKLEPMLRALVRP